MLIHIIILIVSFLFSILFCYYTSDKSYYIPWWDKYIEGFSEDIIEKNKKKFLKEQGRENMTTNQRIKGTMLLVIICMIFCIPVGFGIVYTGSQGNIILSLYFGLFFYMGVLMQLSISEIVFLPVEK